MHRFLAQTASGSLLEAGNPVSKSSVTSPNRSSLFLFSRAFLPKDLTFHETENGSPMALTQKGLCGEVQLTASIGFSSPVPPCTRVCRVGRQTGNASRLWATIRGKHRTYLSYPRMAGCRSRLRKPKMME